jgi:hypothetical protein
MWLVLVAALLHPNSSPKPGELGAFYFDVLNQSQVWVDLDPRVLEEGPNPLRLNVTVAFPGRTLTGAPARVTVRAASNDAAFPLRVRVPVLKFILHTGEAIDLTGPGSVYQFSAGCEKCPANTLTVDMPFAQLQTIAASPLIEADALGFRMRLTPSDVTALRKLVAAVSDGVTVPDH